MSEEASRHTTRLLNRLSDGDESVSSELLERIYGELHTLAESHMARESVAHTMQATALVHEAYLRLVTAEASFASRNHFYALASKVMRSLLVDHARAKQSKKRGGDQARVPLADLDLGDRGEAPEEVDVLQVHRALEELAEIKPDLAQVVELRHFGGLSVPRMAEVLGVSGRTVERRLRTASAWLRKRLE